MARGATMTRGRRARRARPVVLTERDHQLLLVLGLVGYASTEQLCREFFPSLDRCRRRLRALFDARYIAITIAASTASNLISLTRLGQAALEVTLPEAAEGTRLAGAIRLAGVPHHLGVVDTRLYLAALCRAHGHELIAWSGPGSRRVEALGLEGVRPDGLAEISGGGRLVRQALEYDRGHEPGKGLVAKLARYAEA